MKKEDFKREGDGDATVTEKERGTVEEDKEEALNSDLKHEGFSHLKQRVNRYNSRD